MASKGKCPVCRKNVKLDENGKIGLHQRRDSINRNFTIETNCEGIGRDPK